MRTNAGAETLGAWYEGHHRANSSKTEGAMGAMKAAVLAVTIGVLGTLPLSVTPSRADSWPQRTVTLITPMAVGTATDFAARLFANALAERWGKPVIVENRPGGELDPRNRGLRSHERRSCVALLEQLANCRSPGDLPEVAVRSRPRPPTDFHRNGYFRCCRGDTIAEHNFGQRSCENSSRTTGQAQLGSRAGAAAIRVCGI